MPTAVQNAQGFLARFFVCFTAARPLPPLTAGSSARQCTMSLPPKTVCLFDATHATLLPLACRRCRRRCSAACRLARLASLHGRQHPLLDEPQDVGVDLLGHLVMRAAQVEARVGGRAVLGVGCQARCVGVNANVSPDLQVVVMLPGAETDGRM